MSEKVVAIYVSRQFRDKIKAEKRELTYEQYLDNQLKSEGRNPQPKKPFPSRKGDLSNVDFSI